MAGNDLGWLSEQIAERCAQGTKSDYRQIYQQASAEDVSWLSKHMRDYMTDLVSSGSADSALKSEKTSYKGDRNSSLAAIDLVHQAAEAIHDMQRRATEAEARACSIVNHAVEKLTIAQARFQSADALRHAQAQEAREKIEAAMKALDHADKRIAEAQAQALAAEARARRAEAEVSEAQKALARIEEEIRVRLLRRNVTADTGARQQHVDSAPSR